MSFLCGIYSFNSKRAQYTSLLSNMYKALNHRGKQKFIVKNDRYELAIDGRVYTGDLLKTLQKEDLHLLRGEFAVSFWDKEKNRLILFRDQAGIKPLFYWCNEKKLVFASEIKAILQDKDYKKEVNLEGINFFFTFGYVPWPETLFKDIYQIPPGHALICEDSKITIKPYWQFTYDKIHGLGLGINYVENFYKILKEVIELQFKDNIEPAAFLSGGLDSSSIVALLASVSKQKVKTFTAAFEEEQFNEAPIARKVAQYFNTEHYEILIKSNVVREFLPKMIWYTDQPFFDSTAIATYYVARLAKGYVSTIFDAHGPDQLIAGSSKYVIPKAYRWRRSPIPEPLREILAKYVNLYKLKPLEERMLLETAMFPIELKTELLRAQLLENERNVETYIHSAFIPVRKGDLTEKLLYWDTIHMLHDDLMVKVDRMTSAANLDFRMPFLDVKLMDFIAKIPVSLKVRRVNGQPIYKYILKEAMKPYLPEFVLNKKKQGFSIPLIYWLKNDLRDYVKEILLDRQTLNRGYFNPKCIEKLVKEFYAGNPEVRYTQIWALLLFEIWHRTFIDK